MCVSPASEHFLSLFVSSESDHLSTIPSPYRTTAALLQSVQTYGRVGQEGPEAGLGVPGRLLHRQTALHDDTQSGQ